MRLEVPQSRELPDLDRSIWHRLQTIDASKRIFEPGIERAIETIGDFSRSMVCIIKPGEQRSTQRHECW